MLECGAEDRDNSKFRKCKSTLFRGEGEKGSKKETEVKFVAGLTALTTHTHVELRRGTNRNSEKNNSTLFRGEGKRGSKKKLKLSLLPG